MNQDRINAVAQAMNDHEGDMPLATMIAMLKGEGYSQAEIRAGWVIYLESLARAEVKKINQDKAI